MHFPEPSFVIEEQVSVHDFPALPTIHLTSELELNIVFTVFTVGKAVGISEEAASSEALEINVGICVGVTVVVDDVGGLDVRLEVGATVDFKVGFEVEICVGLLVENVVGIEAVDFKVGLKVAEALDLKVFEVAEVGFEVDLKVGLEVDKALDLNVGFEVAAVGFEVAEVGFGDPDAVDLKVGFEVGCEINLLTLGFNV
jgi:hypothetical protein